MHFKMNAPNKNFGNFRQRPRRLLAGAHGGAPLRVLGTLLPLKPDCAGR
jgi:hypothetical protein